MADSYILLWLEAPLQSWGFESRFHRRDTGRFPTKSGVMGLICCAMGLGGEQKEFLAEFSDLDMTVISYDRIGKNPQAPAAKILEDFHMVGSGFDDKDIFENWMIPKKEDGKKAVGGGQKLTYRYYLQDAAFAVVLQVSDHRSGEVLDALNNPVWDLYLGRKTCVPSEIIGQGIFKSRSDGIKYADNLAEKKNRSKAFTVFEGESETEETFALNDIPVSFGLKKTYRNRHVNIVYETVDNSAADNA